MVGATWALGLQYYILTASQDLTQAFPEPVVCDGNASQIGLTIGISSLEYRLGQHRLGKGRALRYFKGD